MAQGLKEFADKLPRGGMTQVAAKIGISPVYFSQLIARQDGREPSPELCVVIERCTGVRRWALRPEDWHRIWPELIGQEGAPEVPAATVETEKAAG